MSSPVHANNRTKDILVLGEGLTQGLDDTTLTVEAKYSVNFIFIMIKQVVIYLLMAQKFINLRQKILIWIKVNLFRRNMSRKHFKRLFCR